MNQKEIIITDSFAELKKIMDNLKTSIPEEETENNVDELPRI